MADALRTFTENEPQIAAKPVRETEESTQQSTQNQFLTSYQHQYRNKSIIGHTINNSMSPRELSFVKEHLQTTLPGVQGARLTIFKKQQQK